MKFCDDHWNLLRAAIDQRGLSPFIAKNNRVAAYQTMTDINRGASGKDTFDPLMQAHWSIMGNAMDTLGRAGYNPLYLLSSETPPPGRNDCPLCELNWLHKESCTDQRCRLDKERGYDWMIDRAADDALHTAQEYGLISS